MSASAATSIVGEEEYVDFACWVLAQLDVIRDGDFTEEVAYQAMWLVRKTVGFTFGVEGEEVVADIPWMHPLYHQTFAQIQAKFAVKHEDADEPSSVGEVEAKVAEVGEFTGDNMEDIEEVLPVPRMCAKRKVALCSVRMPEHKPTTKVMRPASMKPSPSIRYSYCVSHPKGGHCGCWVPGGGKKPFGDWYNGKGHSRAIHLDRVVAAKVIKSHGWSSNLLGWVKEAWGMHRSVQKVLHTADEGSLGDSTASEGLRPPSTKSTKGATSTQTPKDTLSASTGSAKLLHIEISVLCICFAAPVGPSSSSQPAASSSLQAIPLPSLPSPTPVTPSITHLPPPAALCTTSPLFAPCPLSVSPFAVYAPLLPPSFCMPVDASTSAMLPPLPSTPQQLVLGELIERETRWFCETFVRHLIVMHSQVRSQLSPR
ncbi:hypothetical protein BD414DRAFT_540820 [Trametes punicea]|nr:hypothetical protein BD414DRAFT_540820 [Trametes punicea]